MNDFVDPSKVVSGPFLHVDFIFGIYKSYFYAWEAIYAFILACMHFYMGNEMCVLHLALYIPYKDKHSFLMYYECIQKYQFGY